MALEIINAASLQLLLCEKKDSRYFHANFQ